MMKTLISLFVLLISLTLLAQCAPQDRILTIVNDCAFPVWYGFVAGAVPDTTGCAACPSGSSCKNNECFWNLPTPSKGNYKLAAGTNGTATVPFNSNARPEVWSGVIAGRTGCVDGSRCETGDCGSTNHDTDPCTTGFSQPATQAEVTFLKTAQDTYDVEIINGINIPVEMSADVSGNFYGYDCGNPGATTPANPGLGKCTWDFKVPNLYYYWVKEGGPSCSSQADCDSNNQTEAGSVCGLNAEGQNTQLTCGKLLGIYTADQVCGINKNFGSPFDCGANTDLYGCIGAYKDSCYTNGAVSGCCGCIDWATTGLQLPNDTTLCKASTSKWISDSLPKLTWMKTGCPTAYTYPFDDPSSTFTCRDFDTGGNNNANYRITFCPGRTSVNVTIGGNTNSSPSSSLRPFQFISDLFLSLFSLNF